MADVGGHRIHMDCRGTGSPTVVVENGLGDFSFDWALVQSKVVARTRMCTYDRAGYAWSEPGPVPRTFDQLNLELRDALAKLGEKPPWVLVGHSFGGPVVRNFAALHPSDVAGMVLVDSVFEDQRVPMQGKAVRLREGATGKPIPPPRRGPGESAAAPAEQKGPLLPLDPLYRRLPEREQGFQTWAQSLAGLERAENSQR
ncbi:MAG: alpha/beta hydrolase, partial [Acidobacteriota bacterium]|nr:alpha/beta hydrolase [Acidobacteriota bacterium]